MKNTILRACAILLSAAAPLFADSLDDALLEDMSAADVVILGEIHDNPAHHDVQRDIVAALQPKAVVWEMFTSSEARRITSALIHEPDKLATVLDWADSGWPSFLMYHPIFAAAPTAKVFGGEVPRQSALAAIEGGPAVAFGGDATRYGLEEDLPEAEMAEREAHQLEAHCDAIPEHMLGSMVRIQRLRDAILAYQVVKAMEQTGGPVVVITGNGHARRDWGIPVYLERVQPDLDIFVLGQSEDGQINGEFDHVLDSAAIERPDPCEKFRNDG